MFERLAGKNTIITGASSGFGWSTALLFAKYGSNLILTARRENLLQELRNEISKINPGVKVHIMKLDVSDHAAIKEEFKKLPGWASKIDILINNAGLGLGSDQIKDVPEERIDIMFNTNVKGLIWMTQQVLPQMLEANEGHIINIGSIVGFMASPMGGIYSATKHAVRAITDALRMETNSTKIKVSEVMPGLAKTEFGIVKYQGDEAKTNKAYSGLLSLTSQDVAEVIAFTAATHPRSVVSSVTVMPIGQANTLMTHKAKPNKSKL
ncbi:hypothetical protein BB559_001675 [Furculomyces boomerangus]|uniref:Uncharacterized protein n=2 Tax=Harpellales TaxID=61421 RepID=A0A2T9Z130_9FUNG|nr:hypothetical protein BB559_001675 [Furculomyces boomerangus]PVZ97918.1 hypothetical protein BB558_006103 [Smittium angustum]